MWSAVAFAQEAGTEAAKPGLLEQFMPFIFLFIVFFFFIIRPQQKKAKAHRAFLSQIKRGDSVLTASGIMGKIEGLTEKFVTLEVCDGVRLRILRTQIMSSATEDGR